MMMAALANGDERGQRVAHHRQPQRGKPTLRQRGQFKRQRQHFAPIYFAREGAMGENGNRKRSVFAVTPNDGRREHLR